MNNDFAKSILDNPYNRVEDGQKVTLMDILLKYERHLASSVTGVFKASRYWCVQMQRCGHFRLPGG